MTKFAFAAVLLVAVLAGCGDDAPKDVRYLESGKALAAAGNLDKAKVEFGNALQINPKNVDARYQLVLIAEKQSNFAGAFKLLDAVVTEDPNHAPAQAKLGRYYLAQDRVTDAGERAAIAARLDPRNPDLLLLEGLLAARERDFATAEARARALLDAAPDSQDGALLLMQSLRETGRTPQALFVLDQAIARQPKSVPLSYAKAQILLAEGRTDDAIAAYRDLVAAEPGDFENRRNLVALYLQAGRHAEAEAALREMIALKLGGNRPHQQLVRLIREQRGQEAAEAEWLRLIAAEPANRVLRLRLAELYLASGKAKEGEALLRQVIAEEPDGPHGIAARLALARHERARNEQDKAEALVGEILAREPGNADALLLRAAMVLAKGDAEAAIVDLRTVLRDNPASKAALEQLEEAYVAAGKPLLAEETLLRVIQLDPGDPEPKQRLAMLKARSGNTDAALVLLDEVTAEQPNSDAAAVALQKKATLLMSERRWPEAEAALEQLARLPDWQVRALVLTGVMNMVRDRPDEAVAAFERAHALNPDLVEPVDSLVKVQLSRGKPDAAIAFLQRAIRQRPGNAGLYNAVGSIELRRRDWPAAEAAFGRARELNPTWPVPYINLARVYFASDDFTQALSTAEAGLHHAPGNPVLLTLRANSQQRLGQTDAAIATYLTLAEAEPRDLLAVNNAAALIADQRYADAALLQRAVALAGRLETFDDASVQDTVGWVFYRAGDLPRARKALEKAAAGLPDNPVVQSHYGMVLAKLGETAAARRALETALKASAFPGRGEAEAALAALPR